MGSHRVGHDWSDLASAAEDLKYTWTISRLRSSSKFWNFYSSILLSKYNEPQSEDLELNTWNLLFLRRTVVIEIEKDEVAN